MTRQEKIDYIIDKCYLCNGCKTIDKFISYSSKSGTVAFYMGSRNTFTVDTQSWLPVVDKDFHINGHLTKTFDLTDLFREFLIIKPISFHSPKILRAYSTSTSEKIWLGYTLVYVFIHYFVDYGTHTKTISRKFGHYYIPWSSTASPSFTDEYLKLLGIRNARADTISRFYSYLNIALSFGKIPNENFSDLTINKYNLVKDFIAWVISNPKSHKLCCKCGF